MWRSINTTWPFSSEVTVKLYKYRIFNTYSIDSLITKKIWVSKPGDFNDPFDCPATWLTLTVTSRVATKDHNRLDQALRAAAHGYIQWDDWRLDELKKTAYKTVNSTERLSYEQVEEIKNMGIYSLSKTADDVLMWAHYADEHKGFCIEYDMIDKSEGEFEFVSVDYDVTERFKIFADTDIDKLRREASRLKANQWKYEQECRLIYKEGNKAYSEPYLISSIIFGLRMPDSYRQAIRRILCDRSEIKFKEVCMGSQIFQLVVRDLM